MAEQLTRLPPALKEWAVVCKLLLEGRQAVLLRKGGIDERGFWVEADEFFLFPTYFHQMRQKVRPEFGADCEEVMASPPPAGVLRMTGFARVLEAVEVRRPEGMDAIRDLHPYGGEHIATRLQFRPRKPLVVLVVQVSPLAASSQTPMREAYAGCVSWVEVGLERPLLGEPVLGEPALRAIARRVRAAVG